MRTQILFYSDTALLLWSGLNTICLNHSFNYNIEMSSLHMWATQPPHVLYRRKYNSGAESSYRASQPLQKLPFCMISVDYCEIQDPIDHPNNDNYNDFFKIAAGKFPDQNFHFQPLGKYLQFERFQNDWTGKLPDGFLLHIKNTDGNAGTWK